MLLGSLNEFDMIQRIFEQIAIRGVGEYTYFAYFLGGVQYFEKFAYTILYRSLSRLFLYDHKLLSKDIMNP